MEHHRKCRGTQRYIKCPVTSLNLRSRLWFVSRQASVGLQFSPQGVKYKAQKCDRIVV